ncbi:hypothetical protein DFP72DRAFT_480903 [Ephemerocybe angulata]|uniref:Uncharacterized protein n=1 Tax=Ephemerocybe angulata TaxID=980116 RepID=A0A8H6MGG9_9AGAR|nr:hypothetical protein DFP72DRAFT_480903 [Tulosesus angulatus]
MPRALRPRKSQPNYAALAGFPDDNAEAGPSMIIESGDSESDFAPEAKVGEEEEEEEDDELGDEDAIGEDDDENFEEEEVVEKPKKRATAASTTSAKGKAKAPPKKAAPKSILAGAGLPRTSRRQNYMLPTPSVHHRHRATPLFSRPGSVERLVSRPSLFGPIETTLTNAFTHGPRVTDRVNKAWGFNVGSGPIWQIAEDRRWFKEAKASGKDVDTEAKRRPRVYTEVRVKSSWKILEKSEAALHLPTANETTEDGTFKPPPPVPCRFGPIKSQTRREMSMLDSFAMSEYLPESKAYVFNAGAPVWAIDWCPIHPDDRLRRSHKQYLAVAPFPNSSHSPEIGVKVQRPSTACIQIWSLSSKDGSLSAGRMKCEMVLCIDSGSAVELKWCPLPSHDEFNGEASPKKLGLLAGTFEDGSFCVYAVPEPQDLVAEESDEPLLVKLPDPLIRIELPETSCWSFDWANSERVAIGTTNGIIAVYDLARVLHSCTNPDSATVTNLRPSHYITVHQAAIRALAWIQAPSYSASGEACLDEDPTVIASGGYDGVECLLDVREGRGAIMNRTRDVISTLTFSPFAAGPVTMDHENTIKAYAASPSMLGRGHTLLEPLGPVWCVDASDYHPQLAVAAADGTCSTSNMLRSPRRGGSVPFFVHVIYQMDYSRKEKEYRMLDRFLPQEVPDGRSVPGKAGKATQQQTNGTGAWPREVGVHRVSWNNGNGLGSSCLLASSTASGLCRVDVLWGRWIKDKTPYTSVENLRLEGDAMDNDSGLSDGSSASS